MMWHGDLCWEATNGKYKWTAVDWSSESSVGFISWIELNIAMKNTPKKMGQQPLKTIIIIINNCLNSSELVKKKKTIKQIDFHSLFWYVFFVFFSKCLFTLEEEQQWHWAREASRTLTTAAQRLSAGRVSKHSGWVNTAADVAQIDRITVRFERTWETNTETFSARTPADRIRDCVFFLFSTIKLSISAFSDLHSKRRFVNQGGSRRRRTVQAGGGGK